MTAVEWLTDKFYANEGIIKSEWLEKAKEMERKQIGYSEEDVRLAYQKGEEDWYLKGGQTKEMENEFIQSLKRKHGTMKEKTKAIIGFISAIALLITIGTFICSWIFKGTF